MISDDSKGHGILQNKISFTVPSLAFKAGNFKTVYLICDVWWDLIS